MIRVCIFDDHKGVRTGLTTLIDNTEGYVVCGAFSDATDSIRQIKKCNPDVVLMDIQMPGCSGIEAVSQIKSQFPGVRIIMQTVFEDDDKIFASICAGASGYILKNVVPAKILEAISEAFHGGAPMSGSVASRVLTMFKETHSKHEAIEDLTDREKEILQLLVRGLSYKMISDECAISYDTVRFHMKNIYTKLHVTSMTEAVAKAIHRKLV